MLVDTQRIEISSEREAAVDIRCRACSATELRLLGHKDGHALCECGACGVVCVPIPHQEASLGLYDHYYDAASFVMPPVVADSLMRFVRSCEGFRSTNRWLDMGYGEGGMLKTASRFGWQVYGTEISPAAVEFGRRQGWTVATNAETDSRFIDQGFDVVTMIELIEHLPAPAALFQQALKWLRPGGLLYVTTPNARSLNRRILGIEWSIFSPPEHLTVWTARGLRHILTESGFKVGRVLTEGFNPCEILSRRRAGESGSQINRNAAAFALNSAFSSSPFRRAVKKCINTSLSLLNAGDTLKVWAHR